MNLKRALTTVFICFLTLTTSAQWKAFQFDSQSEVPAYNAAPPPKGDRLPAILTKDKLSGGDAEHSYQTRAYELAAKIPVVLHQQPCYCYCDRSAGHNSLHSCFESTHGAKCSTCLKEVYYAYAMHQKGKTDRQIRQGIIQGEWKQIDLETAASN